eukprot:gene6316-10323_t
MSLAALSNIKKKKKKIEITFEDLQHNFEYPIKEAAVNLNVSLTQLKRICRDHDVPRWPHRKLQSLENKIDEMKKALKECDDLSRQLTESKIESYEKEKQYIIDHPKTIVSNKRKSREYEDDDEEEDGPGFKRRSSVSSNDSDYLSSSDDESRYIEEDSLRFALNKMKIGNILNDD